MFLAVFSTMVLNSIFIFKHIPVAVRQMGPKKCESDLYAVWKILLAIMFNNVLIAISYWMFQTEQIDVLYFYLNAFLYAVPNVLVLACFAFYTENVRISRVKSKKLHNRKETISYLD